MSPEEPQLRGEPGEEPVRVKETFSPIKNALSDASVADAGMERAIFRPLQQSVRANFRNEFVKLPTGQRRAEALGVLRTNLDRRLPAVEPPEQKVFLLAELEIGTGPWILDHVPALRVN